jgi:hypothetical protein
MGAYQRNSRGSWEAYSYNLGKKLNCVLKIGDMNKGDLTPEE